MSQGAAMVRSDRHRDNTTLPAKIGLRRLMLRQMREAGVVPVIVEAYGGTGEVFVECYASVPSGVVFDKKPERALHLAVQRPTWAVYRADCVASLAGGAGSHLVATVLDLDPYGDPWPAIRAFFESERPRADKLFVVVNDGMRTSVRIGKAWSLPTLQPAVEIFGNNLHPVYLEVCRWLMERAADGAGYDVTAFAGYYCGHSKKMTHYLAVLERNGGNNG